MDPLTLTWAEQGRGAGRSHKAPKPGFLASVPNIVLENGGLGVRGGAANGAFQATKTINGEIGSRYWARAPRYNMASHHQVSCHCLGFFLVFLFEPISSVLDCNKTREILVVNREQNKIKS